MVAASERSYLLSSSLSGLESGAARRMTGFNDDYDDDYHQSLPSATTRTNRKGLSSWIIGLTIAGLIASMLVLAPSSTQNHSNLASDSMSYPSNRDYWDSFVHDLESVSNEQRHQSLFLEQNVAGPEVQLGDGKHHKKKKHHKHLPSPPPPVPADKKHPQPRSGSSSTSSTSRDAPEIDDNDEEEPKLLYFNSSQAFDMILSPVGHDGHDTPSKKRKSQSGSHDDRSPLLSTSVDFFYYQQGWEAQMNQAYCGVASSVAVMNSLRGFITLPQDKIYDPFPWATQRQILSNDCVKTTVLPTFDYNADNAPMLYAGLGLDMTRKVLSCNLVSQNYDATAIHVDPTLLSVDEIRTIITDALRDPKSRIIVNYDRGGIGQGVMGHGHFSPISAYNADSDSFLVMDVAKYKYPPVWVPAQNLFEGISTIDQCSEFTYPTMVRPDGIDFDSLLKMMNCQSNHRGLIVISPSESDDEDGNEDVAALPQQ